MKSSALATKLVEIRQATFSGISRFVNTEMHAIERFVCVERDAEEQWMRKWKHRVERMAREDGNAF